MCYLKSFVLYFSTISFSFREQKFCYKEKLQITMNLFLLPIQVILLSLTVYETPVFMFSCWENLVQENVTSSSYKPIKYPAFREEKLQYENL